MLQSRVDIQLIFMQWPAWGLYKNAYAMARFEAKFAKRDKARRHNIPYDVLRPDIVDLIESAIQRLEQACASIGGVVTPLLG